MKLVSSRKVVKVLDASKSVEDTLRRALRKAREQKWDKVVIVGEGKLQSSYQTNNLIDTIAAGLCTKAAVRIVSDD